MKKIFTLMIALLSIFAMQQTASALVYNVTVPAGTIECYIAGDFPTMAWSPKDRKLTKIDDTHFTIDIEGATAAMPYKYCSGPDWKYEEFNGKGGVIDNRVYSAADIVLEWKAIYNPNVVIPAIPKQVTIDAFVPLDVFQLYIVGSFNSWALPTDTTKMTLKETTAEGKIYTISFFSKDVNTLEYKFTAGPAWDYEQTASTNFKYPDVTQNTALEVVTGFKKYFDPSKVGNINITATVPAGTQRVWIMGSHLGWSWPKLEEGVKNTDGTFSFVAKDVLSMEYRLYNWNTEWSHPEADDADVTKERPNRKAEYPADANIAITVSAWRNEAPNAVPGLDADKYKVYTSQKSIVVEGVTTKAELFDISGRNIESKVMSGTFRSTALTAGLYIVKIDGQTQKVSIK